MTFIGFTTESEGSPGDLAGKTQGRNHAEETEEGATDSGSSPDTRAAGIEGQRHAPDEAKDDGSESPNHKMSCLAVAGDMARYDDSDGDEEEEEEEEGGADGDAEESDDKAKGSDTNKSRAKGCARLPFDEERANRNSLIFISLLLVVAMPVVVWRSFGQPLILVWRLSVLLCSCCAIWTALLAVTLPAQTVLLRLAFVFVLALYLDAALDPKIGMLMVHLNSHIAVGMMGYALAERRQHDGTELSAATVCIPSDKKQADGLFCAQIIGGAYFGMITLGYGAAVAWVVCHAADFAAEHLVMAVFIPLSGVLFLWITFVGSMLLQGALIAETGFSVLITYLFFMTLLYSVFVTALGDIWAMILTWPLKLGLSGIFGYCICVHATFKLRMRLGLAPLKLDESKEETSLKMLLEKQGHGSVESNPGNSSCSFSMPEKAVAK